MGMEKYGSGGNGTGAGASVIDSIESAWEPGTAGHTRKHMVKGLR